VFDDVEPLAALTVRTAQMTYRPFHMFEGDLSLDPDKRVNAPTHL
jgi:hypothetical protein